MISLQCVQALNVFVLCQAGKLCQVSLPYPFDALSRLTPEKVPRLYSHTLQEERENV